MSWRIVLKSFLLICAFVPSLANASPGNRLGKSDDEWRFTIAFPMLWAPNIDGKIRGDENVDFEVEFADILEDLKFGLMGELYANRGKFGVGFRFNYLNVEDGASVGDPSLVGFDISTDITMGVNDLLFSWEVHENFQLYTGVRHIHSKMKVKLEPSVLGSPLMASEFKPMDDDMFDLLVGVHYNRWLSDRWGILVGADVGVAGDVDRDYSLDIRGLYNINQLHNVWFGWRYLNIGTDSTSNGQTFETDMTQSGPMVGWAFTF